VALLKRHSGQTSDLLVPAASRRQDQHRAGRPVNPQARTPNVTKISWSSESARGLAQSKTLREFTAVASGRQLLDCASPLALWEGRF